MPNVLTAEEYAQALKLGTKQRDAAVAKGKSPNPAVLDQLLPEMDSMTVKDMGLIEIPAERIIGVRSVGRIAALSPGFLPLLDSHSEFATKWMSLCAAHLGEVGIRDPISCYEYLGNFYVQEGNKRVSVLRYFEAPRIPANVKRVLPKQTEEPRIRAYYEFLDFYKYTNLYTVQFRRPKDYDKLLRCLGKEPGVLWTEEERRTFNARFHYFVEAFNAVNTDGRDILPEEALLFWLELYPYASLSTLTAPELKKSLASLWADVVTDTRDDVKMEKKVEEPKGNLISRIISTTPEHLNIAFIQQMLPENSGWAQGHERGREHIKKVFGDKITTRSYYNANTPEAAEKAIRTAIIEGANVIFTTVPLMSKETLKAAVENTKIYFFNCSVDQPYSSLRTYYGRIYEAKFITGAIAGAMAQNNRIGYIGSYPIYGVPASINAFALGAQMTNPRAQIELRWSCVEGTPQADFLADGIRVVSNRDVPYQAKMYLDFCNYGTYLMDDMGELVSLASPVWLWGKFYETAIRGIFNGTLKNDRSIAAPNYWLGMDTGVIDIDLSDKLPEGVKMLANTLRGAIRRGELDPFARRIVAQDGTVKGDGKGFALDELLHMDWLCENVTGSFPDYSEIMPRSLAMVRKLGIYKQMEEKEGAKNEDSGNLR